MTFQLQPNSSSMTPQQFSRRDILRLGASALVVNACAGLLGGVEAGAEIKGQPTPRHIIFCLTDDQGWGETGYAGHPVLKTPHLDAMAKNGLRLDRFYAASPVCSPTRAGCLSGQHPYRLRVDSWGYDMPASTLTIAKQLSAAGFATGHFGKWHLGGLPAAPGKSEKLNRAPLVENAINGTDAERGPGGQGFQRWISASNFYDIPTSDLLLDQGKPYRKRPEDTSDTLVEEALRFIQTAIAADKPSFTAIWFPSPHKPYDSLPADVSGVGGSQRLGEIVGIDRAMGTLRESLKTLKIDQQTLLWFCSDNGCAENDRAGTGGLSGYKGDVLEGGIRVPGLIEWPGVIAPAQSKVPCSVLDLFPTVAGLYGLPVPDDLDGIDIRPVLFGTAQARQRPLIFAYEGKWAMVDNDLKLHIQGKNGQALAYDLEHDPVEKKDVSDHPAVKPRVKELLQYLDDWQKKANQQRKNYIVAS